MSTGPLPRQADIRKLASLDAVLEGSVKVAKLDRVVQALATDSGSVNYRLQFGVSDEGINCITGRLDSVVELTCQRCLEPMEYAVASEFVLGAVSSDEKARHLPKRLEPLLVEDDLVDTQAVIEEELLLCLPIVCYHPAEQCAQQVGYQTPAVVSTEALEEPRKNPFDALAALKKPEP